MGDYEILGEIARGGMGVVYRARQVSLNREVALKMVGGGHLASPHEVERFKVEAEAAARLDHPNILPVHDVGTWEGRQFFTMKLVEGGSLADEIKGHPLTARESVKLMIKLADAVHYAHERGVMHRDLKPSNILLDSHGEPQLTDFGLAKIQEREAGLTQSVAVMGSVSYMAPESARGEARDLTTASDVYGLGAVLYEVLTGHPPFEGASFVDILGKVVSEDPRRPSLLCQAVDRDLETVCLKCLEKHPRDRYGSALELARDLQRWLRHEPVEARPLTTGERIFKWIRRRPAIAGLSLALGLVTVFGFAAVVLQWRAAVRARHAAEESMRAEITARAPVIAPKATVTLSGDAALTLLFPDAQRALVNLEEGPEIRDFRSGRDAVKLKGFRQHLQWAALSGGGERLLSISSTQRNIPRNLRREPGGVGGTDPFDGEQWVQVWETASGRLLHEFSESNLVHGAALNLDGSRYALTHVDGQVTVWDPDAGTRLHALVAHAGTAISAAFSPDSQRCLTTSMSWVLDSVTGTPVSEQSIAMIFEMPSGRKHPIPNRHWAGPFGGVGMGTGAAYARWSRDGRFVLTLGFLPENTAVWDGVTGSFLYELELDDGFGRIADADFSPDHRCLVTVHEDYTARIWDVASGELLSVLRGHDYPIQCVRYSSDGRRILTASADGTIRIWDAGEGVGLAVLKGHEGKVLSAEFSPDGSEVVSVGDDRTVRLWDAATLEQLSITLERHESTVTDLMFSPDSRILLSGARSVCLAWELSPARVRHEFRPGRSRNELEEMFGVGEVQSVAFAAEGRWVALATADSHLQTHTFSLDVGGARQVPYTPVRVWDMENGAMRLAPSGFETQVEHLQVSPDGRYLLAVPGQLVVMHELSKMMGEVRPWIYQTNAAQAVRIWEVSSGRELPVLGPLQGFLKSAAWNRAGDRIAVAGWGGVSLWSFPQATLLTNLLPGHLERVGSQPLVAEAAWWTRDDQHLVVAFDGRWGLWNPVTGLPIHVDEGQPRSVFQRHFDVEHNRLTVLTRSGECLIWDVVEGSMLRSFSGLGEKPMIVAWSPDGRWLAVKKRDRETGVWDLTEGREVVVLGGHLGHVSALAFSPDLRWLATGDGVGRVRVWPMAVIAAKNPSEPPRP